MFFVILFVLLIINLCVAPARLILFASGTEVRGNWPVLRGLADAFSLVLLPIVGLWLAYLSIDPLPFALFVLMITPPVVAYYFVKNRLFTLRPGHHFVIQLLLLAGCLINLIMGLRWLENAALLLITGPIAATLLLGFLQLFSRRQEASPSVRKQEVLDYFPADIPAEARVSSYFDVFAVSVAELPPLVRLLLFCCGGALYILAFMALSLPFGGNFADSFNLFWNGVFGR